MSPDAHLDAVAGRLRADGAEVSTVQIRGLTALVGYRSAFRWQWMATRVNLFTVLISVPSVTAADLEQFTNDALDYAVSQKGKFRGLQNGAVGRRARFQPRGAAGTIGRLRPFRHSVAVVAGLVRSATATTATRPYLPLERAESQTNPVSDVRQALSRFLAAFGSRSVNGRGTRPDPDPSREETPVDGSSISC